MLVAIQLSPQRGRVPALAQPTVLGVPSSCAVSERALGGQVLVEIKIFDVAEAAAARPKVVERLESWQVLGTRVSRAA